jgi:hypothetical protein
MPNEIGKLRRSTTVTTFGPGSIIDFRTKEGGPVSGVAAGLESWDQFSDRPGLEHPQKIIEPRLQDNLRVKGFRLPPVTTDDWGDGRGQMNEHLVAVRFPDWLQCQECHRIAPSKNWNSKDGKAFRYCGTCTAKKNNPEKNMVFAVPVRFVMACEDGHIQDFPWHYWVGHEPDCKNKYGDLELKSEHAGLAGYILRCPKCNAQRSLDGIFSRENWRGFHCNGWRPWLPGEPQECHKTPRVLQRGASNMYFPVVQSALSIPPWSDKLIFALGSYWADVISIPDAGARARYIRSPLLENFLPRFHERFGLSREDMAQKIEALAMQVSEHKDHNLREEEYDQFTLSVTARSERDPDFEIRTVTVPESLKPFFSGINRAVRLREVRALTGFTRVKAPENENDPAIAKLSVNTLEWLPAIDVHGEGIFIKFNIEHLLEWEHHPIVIRRAQELNNSYIEEWKDRYDGALPTLQITPRLLLIHTFAHSLMKRLSFECGYSGASLRERLYVSEGPAGMCGVLIYTATSDSDGTLGGLQRQGEKGRIAKTVRLAIKDMEWCSSDPLCIQNMVSAKEHHSLAACHACVLASETSCEYFNRFLDRAMLVGLPEHPDAGYFRTLLRD